METRRSVVRDRLLDVLDRYERALRDAGGPAAERFAPGLTDAALDAWQVRARLVLPMEVRVLWSWHDGHRPLPGEDPFSDALRMTTPAGFLLSSDEALAHRDRMRELTSWHEVTDDVRDWAGDWHRSWLPLVGLGADVLFVDCTQESPVGTVPLRHWAHVPEDPFTPVTGSLTRAFDAWLHLLSDGTFAWPPGAGGWVHDGRALPRHLHGLVW